MNQSQPYTRTGIRLFFLLTLLGGLFCITSCNNSQNEINHLQQQVWKNPQDTRGYVLLGNAYARNQQYNEASDAFKSALAINPELDEACHALAAIAFNQKKYIEALKLFQQRLEHAPKDSLRLYDLGNVYMQLKQYDNAAEFYNKAIDNSNSFVEAHYNLAVCYSKTGHSAEAKAIYDWLLDKNNYLAVSLQKHLKKEQR